MRELFHGLARRMPPGADGVLWRDSGKGWRADPDGDSTVSAAGLARGEQTRAWLLAVIYFSALFFAAWLLRDAPLSPRPTGVLLSSVACLFAAGGVVLAASSSNWEPAAVPHWRLLVLLALLAAIDVVAILAGYSFVSSLAVLLGATLVGAAIDRYAFIDRSILLLLCALYIVVDTYSVFFGPTGAIVQRGGPLLGAMAVQFPIVATGRIAPLIGGTDFAIWTACLLGARRFGFDYAGSFAAMAVSLIVTSVGGIMLGRAVPALPLMMIAYLWVNRRHFEFRDRELWLLGGLALAIVLGIGVAARWLLTR